jgi:hypothetical protein
VPVAAAPPLTSTRPTEPEYPAHQLATPQDLDARLWEDPIGAVMRDIDAKRLRDPPDNGGHTGVGFDHHGNRTLVLGVTLPGASYPEVAETRRRLRYAVLSALHVAQFTPIDEMHIGYWRLKPDEPATNEPQTKVSVNRSDWPGAIDVAASDNGLEVDLGIGIAIRAASKAQLADDPAGDQSPLPAIVPWEEFDRGQQHVLVLWLDEDVLTAGRHPIASLVKLRLQTGYPTGSPFTLLGPEDSTMLEAMVREEPKPKDARFSVYNFGATAEEARILPTPGENESIQQFLLKQYAIQYYRTVNTDEQLAETLACELMRRDANLALFNGKCSEVSAADGPHDHVVLISDWDTVYGNRLFDCHSGREKDRGLISVAEGGYIRLKMVV